MKPIKALSIDLNRPQKNIVHLVQGDTSRRVLVNLLLNGAPYDVSTDYSGTIVKGIAYIKANGIGGYYEETTTGDDAVTAGTNANQWIIAIDNHATDVPGFAECFVKFSTEDGYVLHSFPITLYVDQSAASGGTDPNEPYYQSASFLIAGNQAVKTSDMTSPVGVDSNGKLWVSAGWSQEAIDLLIACFEQVAWATTGGQDLVDDLVAALFPESNLVSITASYEQDRPIYDADSAETNYAKVALDLIVTAHYSDGTSETVTGYTLSGDFTVGTSTITVTFQGKNTSISVSVLPMYILTEYIENEGDSNSWIELDVVPSNTFGFKANISFAQRTSDLFVFGTREISDGRILMGVGSSKKPYFGWGAESSNTSLISAIDWGTQFVAKLNYKNDKKAMVNDSDTWGSDLPALGFTPTWPWIVLGFRSSDTPTGRQCKIYKEGIEITDGGNVIRDLRPCYRATDNAIGLVDILTNTFYGNSGTGSLAKGADLT